MAEKLNAAARLNGSLTLIGDEAALGAWREVEQFRLTKRQADNPPDHIWLSVMFVMTALCTAAAFVLGTRAGIDAVQVYFLYITRIFMLAPLLMVAGGSIAVLIMVVNGDEKPLETLAAYFAERFGRDGSLSAVLGPILLVPLLMGAFGTLKQLIPLYNPFSWDDTFANVGSYMFFGTTPWRVTHFLFGSPVVTLALDRLYAAWVPILFLITPTVAIAAPPLLRARFFLSFSLGFILIGVIGAYYFSSAGPCFAAHLHTASAARYDELMQRLHAINDSGYRLSAVYFQDHLWRAYQNGEYGFGNGISAMPSMHNAVALLYALSVGGLGWRVRTAAGTFAVLIFIGSVHLGWHYTSDGVVAWAAMFGIWRLTGWYLRASGYEAAVTAPKAPRLVLVVDNDQRLAA
jgi:hypothetical protein